MSVRHNYTIDQVDFIKSICLGKSTFTITKMFNDKFGTKLSRSQIRACMKNRKITNQLDTRIKPGNIPLYKGTKGLAKANKTSFKKGMKPHNYLPVGSEADQDGYIAVKIADPNIWERKHRLIWEETNGPVPSGMCIIFLDGDKRNFNIENLAIISREELGVINRKGLNVDDPEATRLGITTAKLILKTADLKRRVSN